MLDSSDLGSHNLLTVRTGEDMLKVSAPPDLFPAPDTDVWLRIAPERIRWMHSDSGAAVADPTDVPPSPLDVLSRAPEEPAPT